jgi:hypothetical protein
MAKPELYKKWGSRGGKYWESGDLWAKTPNYPVVTPPNLRTPAQPKKAETSWANWAPYFRGLGIYPRGNYLTATSPALRARLAPNALTAMQNYFATSPRSWADYLTYAGRFMSRTPALSGRFWNPARWR